MRGIEVTFTTNPAGAGYTAKLCYTCKTADELEEAKRAITGYLDQKISQARKEEDDHDE